LGARFFLSLSSLSFLKRALVNTHPPYR
jgi:hypothetical protein